MKTTTSSAVWQSLLLVGLWASSNPLHAGVIFSDNFASGPSPAWGNERGAWIASSGAYYATVPSNAPNDYSSLPYQLMNFSIDLDINNVSDGGIFLRATAVPGSPNGIKGVLFNLKVPAGGPRIYWHIFFDGTNVTPPLNVTYLNYGTSPHVHITVSGDLYQAFINGDPTPATTLRTNLFSAGRVALYDFSAQSFSNVVLERPDPSLYISMNPDATVISWSTDYPDYVLQTTADLSAPTHWFSFPGPYASSGGSYLFRLPRINLLPKQFFRLTYPGP